MPYTKETIAEVIAAFDRAYEEHKHEWPTKICGPNLVGILNSAGFYKKEEWVGLTGTEINHVFASNVGYPEHMMREVEALLKERNT